jgi:hypothetical protein
MQNLPFDKPGRFYKGNLHCHSTVSDGRLTPEEVCNYYRAAGYNFLSVTDHFMNYFHWKMTDTTPYRTPDFTTLIGAELHAPGIEFDWYPWHILAVGLPPDFAPVTEGETGFMVARRAIECGAFVTIAHPDWYNLSEADARTLGDLHAIEVFNGTSVDHNDKPGGWSLLDLLLTRGYRYNALATDDAHFHPERADTLLGWTMVKAEELTPEAILQALRFGHYYSSTGPTIYDIQVIPGDRVYVRCSPASRIFVTGAAFVAASEHGNGIIEAEISLKKFPSPFGRVTVRDAYQRRAWSNPFWFE